MLPIIASAVSTTASAVVSTAPIIESFAVSSAPIFAAGFTAGSYLSNPNQFKTYVREIFTPTYTQIASSLAKTILLDGALNFHFTGDLAHSVKAAVIAFPSYLIRSIHQDPYTACAVGAMKYATNSKSMVAGCINHFLYSKTFDMAPLIGDFTATSIIEGGDHYAKKIFVNNTLEDSDLTDAAITGIVSGVTVTGSLIPILGYIGGIAQQLENPEMAVGGAIIFRVAMVSAINEAIITLSKEDYLAQAYEITHEISEMFHNKTPLSGESIDTPDL